MPATVPPKGPIESDADVARAADGTSDYAASPTARATPDPRVTTERDPARVHPRASADVAPEPTDEIVRAADGSSDYAHSDMADAVDEAQHKRPK